MIFAYTHNQTLGNKLPAGRSHTAILLVLKHTTMKWSFESGITYINKQKKKKTFRNYKNMFFCQFSSPYIFIAVKFMSISTSANEKMHCNTGRQVTIVPNFISLIIIIRLNEINFSFL